MGGRIDSERFARMFLPHLDAAYNLARWLTRDDSDAQDVVQEAYLRAIEGLEGFRGAGDGRPWLLAIVRNTFYSWRKKNRGPQFEPFDEEAHGAHAKDGDPEALLLAGAGRQRIEEALAALPLEFREVVVLRELEDLSYREIAEVVGVPVGTVMSRLARGRKRLAEQLRMSKEAA